jgi:hypothetical protein
MKISYKNKEWYIMSIIVILSISTVHAQSWAPTETITDMIFNVLWSLLNLLYLITLPVLVIAGKAMDNSMVYGEFINLDKPLYMLWNLCRTFANFAIGGVILRKIIKYIFTDRSWKSPDFLKKTIISSVSIVLGINFSWFLIWALIDISTILTYSLWAMPLSILKETNSKDMPILSVVSYFDYQSESEKRDWWTDKYIKPYTYYQWWSINIPKCTNDDKNILYKWLVVWPEYSGEMPNNPSKRFDGFGTWNKQYCAINSQTLADITALEEWKKKSFQTANWTTITTNNDKNEIMKNVIDHITTVTWWCDSDFIFSWFIDVPQLNQWQQTNITVKKDALKQLETSLVIGDGQISTFSFCKWGSTNYITKNNAYIDTWWQSSFLQGWNNSPYNSQAGLTMNTLINQSKGMVWPFVTLYMSLLDFSNLSVQGTQDKTQETTFGGITEFLLKWAISIALFIPLVALAFVLIVRIVVLRGVIAFIPLGIVAYSLFDKKEQDLWGKWDRALWKISPGSILWLIFAPILPVFAISISIIILQTLQISMKDSISENNKTRDFLGIKSEPDEKDNNKICMDFRWLQTTCLKKGDAINGWFTNFLPWLFVNIFAIGLMWMMVKTAMAWSSITSSIGNNIMKLWANALWSIPLVKIWWVWVGANSLSQAPWKALGTARNVMDTWTNKQDTAIEKLLNPEKFKNNDEKDNNTLSIKDTKKIQDSINTSIQQNPKSSPQQHFEKALKTHEEDVFTKFSKLNQNEKTNYVIDFMRDNHDTIQTKEAIVEWWRKLWYIDESGKKINEWKINDFIIYLNGTSIMKAIVKDPNIKKTIEDDFWLQYNENNKKRTSITN